MIESSIDLTDGQRERLMALSFPIAGLMPAEYPIDAALALAGLAKCIAVGDKEMTAATEMGVRQALRIRRLSTAPAPEVKRDE